MFWENVDYTFLPDGLFAFAMPVFGTGTAGKIDFDDFDLFARGVAEGRRAHQGDGFRVEQVRGVKKSGIPADHEVGLFHELTGFQ